MQLAHGLLAARPAWATHWPGAGLRSHAPRRVQQLCLLPGLALPGRAEQPARATAPNAIEMPMGQPAL